MHPISTAAFLQAETPQQGVVHPTPQAPRRMLRPAELPADSATPMPTPVLNMSGLQLKSDDPTPAPQPPSTAPDHVPEHAYGPFSKAGMKEAKVPPKTLPQDTLDKASREVFKKRVQTVFAELMAKGGMLPNDAAIAALDQVSAEKQQGS